MFLVSASSCLCVIYWSHVLNGEWRYSWSSADRRCSNYIWVINNLIAYWGASYITVETWRYGNFCKISFVWFSVGQSMKLLFNPCWERNSKSWTFGICEFVFFFLHCTNHFLFIYRAPFTIQRLCELITNPRKHYRITDKFMRGLEKVRLKSTQSSWLWYFGTNSL